MSTGLYTTTFETGYFFKSCFGRFGRFSKPPPQLGHTSINKVTQSLQNVHSKVQIIASEESNGKSLLQFSQVGLISNIIREVLGFLN